MVYSVVFPESLHIIIDLITAVVGKTGDVPVTPGDALGIVSINCCRISCG